MLRLQILAIGGTAFINVLFAWLLWGTIPLIDGAIGFGGVALFILLWGGSVAWIRLRKLLPEDTPEAWYGNTIAGFWVGNIAMSAPFFFIGPHLASDTVLLTIIMSMMGNIIQLLATVRPPQYGPRGLAAEYAPIAMPVFQIVYFLIYWKSYWYWPVIIFWLVSFCFAAFILRRMLQDSLDDADAARQIVISERDAKTRFLTSASHDLGQPLQSARLFFDLALRSGEGEKREKAVRGVHWAFDASEQLLGQMMAHLQLESGVVEPALQALVIGPLIAEVADMHEPAAGLTGVSLHAMPCGLKVESDPALVVRALGNLIGNAIRHAKAKRILIGARMHQGGVRIWVIDDGVGIAPSDIPRLFDDYVQGSDHGEEIRGGFGLGLATTQRLARLMCGDAGLEAKWVNGSAFWLELPAA
jgi:signal transduction histidine kinase